MGARDIKGVPIEAIVPQYLEDMEEQGIGVAEALEAMGDGMVRFHDYLRRRKRGRVMRRYQSAFDKVIDAGRD